LGRRSRHRIRAGLQPPKEPQARSQSAAIARRIEHQFACALGKFDVGQANQTGPELAALTGWWTERVGRSAGVTPGLVPALVSSYLCGEVDQAWERGWQPADIHRVVARSMSANHAQLAVGAIAEQSEVYRSRQRVLPSWLAQLDEIRATPLWDPADDHLALFAEERDLSRADLLRTAFELIVVLHRLPAIPLLVPPPSQWDRSAALDATLAWRQETRQAEVRHLERVRALLAKAESTEFDEEADALTAKAQELMTRHAIDDALLAAHAAGKRSGEQPSAVRIGIDDPYAQAKATLLAVIGEASRCRAIWSKDLGYSTVFGFTGDLASVELLYTSLLLQASSAMVRAGDRGKQARRSSYRRSFLLGFAIRIGRRLEEAASSAVADAVEERGSALLPVLAERSCRVEEFRNEAFPDVAQHRITMGDWAGWASGVAAADAAVIARGPSIEETASH
jgi:Protein of unknown function (DUF2786)